MSIQWRHDLAIDHSIIDDDHQYLFQLINEFESAGANNADQAYAQAFLKTLTLHTIHHFQREEKLQIAVRYPYWEAHAREHRSLIKALNGLAERFNQPEDAQKTKDAHQQLATLLREWLVNHLIHSDLRMRPYVLKMKPFTDRLSTLQESCCRSPAP